MAHLDTGLSTWTPKQAGLLIRLILPLDTDEIRCVKRRLLCIPHS